MSITLNEKFPQILQQQLKKDLDPEEQLYLLYQLSNEIQLGHDLTLDKINKELLIVKNILILKENSENLTDYQQISKKSIERLVHDSIMLLIQSKEGETLCSKLIQNIKRIIVDPEEQLYLLYQLLKEIQRHYPPTIDKINKELLIVKNILVLKENSENLTNYQQISTKSIEHLVHDSIMLLIQSKEDETLCSNLVQNIKTIQNQPFFKTVKDALNKEINSLTEKTVVEYYFILSSFFKKLSSIDSLKQLAKKEINTLSNIASDFLTTSKMNLVNQKDFQEFQSFLDTHKLKDLLGWSGHKTQFQNAVKNRKEFVEEYLKKEYRLSFDMSKLLTVLFIVMNHPDEKWRKKATLKLYWKLYFLPPDIKKNITDQFKFNSINTPRNKLQFVLKYILFKILNKFKTSKKSPFQKQLQQKKTDIQTKYKTKHSSVITRKNTKQNSINSTNMIMQS